MNLHLCAVISGEFIKSFIKGRKAAVLPCTQTLLHFATIGAPLKGSVTFLLKNGADVQSASLVNALCHYLPSEVVKLLLRNGIEIKDHQLALARCINHGEFELVDIFMDIP